MIGSNVIGSVPIGSCFAGTIAVQDCQIWINGVDVTANLFIGADASQGISISEILTGATTASLNLVEEDASSGPQLDIEIGHEVIIEVQAKRLFGGQVEDIARTNPGQSNAIFWRLTLKDFSACLERRLVIASFEDLGDPITQTAGSIITSIFNSILDDGCLMLGTVEDGPLIQKINFNYVPVIGALNELQKLTGNAYYWKVNEFGILSFLERTAIPAPYSITDAQVDILNIDFDSTRESYRNRQYVRGGKTETEPRINEFVADGKEKTFTCDLPLAAKPIIKVNTIAVNPSLIGIKGVDDDSPGITWLWARDDDVVAAKTAPSLNDDIEITFQGLFPVIIQQDNTSEQTARAAIEKGNGLYEAVEIDESLNQSGTRQKAEALIDKYAKIPKRISYQTDRAGDVRPGHLQSVSLTVLDVPIIEMVIEQVDTTLIGKFLRRTIHATDGREWLEWLEFFRSILKDPFLIRENEAILIPTNIDEDLAFTDSTAAVASDATIAYTSDPYTWMIVGPTYRIGKAIDDLAVTLFENSEQVNGPKIGTPVNI